MTSPGGAGFPTFPSRFLIPRFARGGPGSTPSIEISIPFGSFLPALSRGAVFANNRISPRDRKPARASRSLAIRPAPHHATPPLCWPSFLGAPWLAAASRRPPRHGEARKPRSELRAAAMAQPCAHTRPGSPRRVSAAPATLRPCRLQLTTPRSRRSGPKQYQRFRIDNGRCRE